MTEAEVIYSDTLYHLPSPVTVVIEKPWASITHDERIQLSKILNALKLGIDRVRIIHQPSLDLNKLVDSPRHLIVFGLTLPGVNAYEALTVSDKKVVLAESLTSLLPDDAAKKKLWLALKAMFGL
jgi:hypothetical protein